MYRYLKSYCAWIFLRYVSRIHSCSGGQLRCLSFALAILHEPDLLVLDEPTVGLDPIVRHE